MFAEYLLINTCININDINVKTHTCTNPQNSDLVQMAYLKQ